MATKEAGVQPYIHARAVTVSVTYHRSCLVLTDGFENIEDAVRRQMKFPDPIAYDPDEWFEDEFVVIEEPDSKITIQMEKIEPIKK